MIFQAQWGLFAWRFVTITKSTAVMAITSVSQAHLKRSEILKNNKISTMAEEEMGYESDSLSDISGTTAAIIVLQRQGKTKDHLPQPFSNGLQPFISEIWKSFYH
jgi:hypothetical protein